LARELVRLLPRGHFEPVPGRGLRNVVGMLPGRTPGLVIGAHYDTLVEPEGFLAANNGAAGSAIVVPLARDVQRLRPTPAALRGRRSCCGGGGTQRSACAGGRSTSTRRACAARASTCAGTAATPRPWSGSPPSATAGCSCRARPPRPRSCGRRCARRPPRSA